MVKRYFENFPVVTYANTQIVDITRRVKVLENISTNPYVFYPYELDASERADQFSSRYYQDSFKSWIVYLSNNITDPYYGWYMQNEEFNSFLVTKYVSLANAYNKTSFYRNNWSDVPNIAVNNFDALPTSLQKYWLPVYGSSGVVTSYSRVAQDWTINTNKVVSFPVSNTSFAIDEICNIVYSNNVTGTGQAVQTINGNTLYLQHVSGTFLTSQDGNFSYTASNTGYIYGTQSGVNTAFTGSTLQANNLLAEEEAYWAPVTYYEYESEKNEFNKTIRVLDNRLSGTVANNLRDLMAQ